MVDPPALTEPYQKARRNYVLFSALLIAWELIGFDVTEVPLEHINITIKSPQAIPFVLLALIGYFSMRLLQEWYQCDIRRRSDKWALSDFISANFIAGMSIGIYISQRLLKMQLADLVSGIDFAVCFTAFSAGVAAAAELPGWKERTRTANAALVLLLSFGFVGSLSMFISQSETPLSILAWAAVLSFAVGVSTVHGVRRLTKGSFRATLQRTTAEDREETLTD